MGWVSEDSEGYNHVWGKVENAVKVTTTKTPPSINKSAPASPGVTVKDAIPHSPITVQGSGPVPKAKKNDTPVSKGKPTAKGETKPNEPEKAEPAKADKPDATALKGIAPTFFLHEDGDLIPFENADILKDLFEDNPDKATQDPQPVAWIMTNDKGTNSNHLHAADEREVKALKQSGLL